MKFSIPKKTLERVMTHSAGIIEKRQTIPILGYAMFNASKEEGVLTVTSTNMDMTIVDKVKCDVEKSGTYCLPAALLYDITKKMKSESTVMVSINESENSVSVSAERATFNIHYVEKDSFPPIAEAEYTVRFRLVSDVFKKSVDIARVAMLQDNTRFHLNGIHMHHENDMGVNKLRFVATDLFRISCVSIVAPSETQSMPPIIVSKKAVGEILKLVDDSSSEAIDLSVSSNRISFKLSDDQVGTEFSSRLINGTFPEYKSALNVSNDKILQVNTEEFIDAIDRVSTVVVDSTSSIKLNIHSDKLILTGISKELGSAVEEIEATFNAFDPMEICFNSRYLIEILSRIETDMVKMALAESDSSTIVAPVETSNQELQFAIMPIEIVKN
jgi:DNA polymerase-3 subunit beta